MYKEENLLKSIGSKTIFYTLLYLTTMEKVSRDLCNEFKLGNQVAFRSYKC